jgi:hypothetical protein
VRLQNPSNGIIGRFVTDISELGNTLNMLENVALKSSFCRCVDVLKLDQNCHGGRWNCVGVGGPFRLIPVLYANAASTGQHELAVVVHTVSNNKKRLVLFFIFYVSVIPVNCIPEPFKNERDSQRTSEHLRNHSTRFWMTPMDSDQQALDVVFQSDAEMSPNASSLAPLESRFVGNFANTEV